MKLETHEIPGAEPALVFLHEGLGAVALWRDFPARLAEATIQQILDEGERAAAVWAPEQAERVVNTLRRRMAAVR